MSAKKNIAIESKEVETIETATAVAAEEIVATAAATEAKQLGRPVNAESERQKRLAAKAALIASGIEVKRGRHINGESERQKRLAGFAAKIAAGVEVKRGRPKKVVAPVETVSEVAPA